MDEAAGGAKAQGQLPILPPPASATHGYERARSLPNSYSSKYTGDSELKHSNGSNAITYAGK